MAMSRQRFRAFHPEVEAKDPSLDLQSADFSEIAGVIPMRNVEPAETLTKVVSEGDANSDNAAWSAVLLGSKVEESEVSTPLSPKRP